MAEARQEKRAARRFALRVPVTVDRGTNGSKAEMAEIRDVSARRICCDVDSAMEQGAPIGFSLSPPPEITLNESTLVQFHGHVVRVEHGMQAAQEVVAAVSRG